MVHTATRTDLAAILRQFIEASVIGNGSAVGALVTEGVTGWTPTLTVSSRRELLEAVEERNGAFAAVDVRIGAVDVLPDKAIAEWRLSALFNGDLEIDGITIPATGRALALTGATFAEFDGARIKSFRHYFDDAALIEQLLDV